MVRKISRISAALTLVAVTASAFAGPITTGNLVAVRFGTPGATSLAAGGTATYLLEFTTAGAPVQTIPMPTSASGSNRQFTNSGTATSEGFLALSSNGQYLTLAGYDAALGTANIATSAWNTVNRVVGRVALDGTIDTSTALSDTISGGNARSAVMNGNDIWVTSSAGGMRYTTYGSSSTSVQLSTTPTNVRVGNIYNGQLYTSSASGTFFGPATVGSGLPTTSGQTTTLLPGFPTVTGPSSYDYWFANDSTVYVADDRNQASGGGIQKWTLDSGTWTLAYTLAMSLPGTAGCRGLAGTMVGGNAVLYATTAQANNNNIVSVTDTGALSAFSTLASSGNFNAFRGIEFIVPEPGTIMLLCLGGLALRRRRA